MTIEDLRQKVYRDLESRGLANPSIRKRALDKILSFIQKKEIYGGKSGLILPSDKDSLKSAYRNWKEADLNSAESSVINTMYEHYKGKYQSCTAISIDQVNVIKSNSNSFEISNNYNDTITESIEKNLINGAFLGVNELNNGEKVPEIPGLYCIKLKEEAKFPTDYGKIQKDGIIYIGIASKSLKERLWEEELNHQRPATFFRSIGAMLGFLPPKGSLIGKKNTRNYKFSIEDTEKIKTWMNQSLLVSFVQLKESKEKIEEIEILLIKKFSPLVNIEHNENKSKALIEARAKCVQWANMKE